MLNHIYIYQIRRLKGSDDVPIMLVGNKIDLPKREVDRKYAQVFARQRNLVGYIETSAKTRQRVDDAFYSVIQEMQETRRDPASPDKLGHTCACITL